VARARNSLEDFDYSCAQEQLIVYHHLGLGDHIICMGLVLELADRFARGSVHLAVKRGYLDTVRALYARAPKVQVFPVDAAATEQQVYEHARRLNLKVARIVMNAHDRPAWDRSFYEQVGIDFELSWERFTPGDVESEAEELFRRLVGARPYQLVHDDGSIGHFALHIPENGARLYVRPEPSASGLLAWTKIIREASEIHCIDSSVVHLVDRMPDVPGQQLFLHDARNSGCAFTRRRAWQFITYDK
jgi:hypothetical protein